MTACEGEEGREQRCVWSHGQQYESEQELVAQLIATGAVDVNVLDVVLGVLFVLSMTLVMWRLYRCWMKRGYIKLGRTPLHLASHRGHGKIVEVLLKDNRTRVNIA